MTISHIILLFGLILMQILIVLVSFAFGWWIGSKSIKTTESEMHQAEYRKIKNKNNLINNKPIEIDDKKIVLKINTNNIEKKFEQISNSSEAKNDINSSVNKLKHMKGK